MSNQGFEDSTPFHYWRTTGDTQIQTSAMGDTPPEGTHQALLATATDGSLNAIVTPGAGVSESELEYTLGLQSGSLSAFSGSTILAGSGIAQSVSLVGGDKLSFSWDFLTNQTYNDGTSDSIAPTLATNDFSFFDFEKQGGSSALVKLADTFYGYQNNPSDPGGFATGFMLTASDNPFISETGYQTFTWTVPTTGTYLIGAGVVHVTTAGTPDDGVNSALLLDNFQVAAVPEPGSFAGLATLSLGLIWRRRSHANRNC